MHAAATGGQCAVVTVRAHRHDVAPLGALVVHLDQSGLFGARSTVARASSRLGVRLHVCSCERKVVQGRGTGAREEQARLAAQVRLAQRRSGFAV